MRTALALIAAAALGWLGADALREPATPSFPGGAPAPGSDVVAGRVADPYGRPPGVPRDSSERGLPEPPPWSVLTWRTPDGRTCHEAGVRVDDRTPGRGDQIPGVRAGESTLPEPLVGSLRPDSRSGTGIQFYDLGRFLGHPLEEGGSCGRLEAGAGVLVSYEHRFARRDLGPDRTVVSGVAGRRVAAVRVDGRVLPFFEGRSFLALFDGIRRPRIVIGYRDESARELR